jgi:hypothetical protein
MARKIVVQVGDVIRRRGSKDEASIVRTVDCSEIHPPDAKGKRPKGVAYIVLLPANQYRAAKEALWHEEDIDTR